MTNRTVAYRGAGATGRARRLRRQETEAEAKLWYRLRGSEIGGYKFKRQVPLGPYVVDFLCRSKWLVVELDGEQHVNSSHDIVRTGFLNKAGFSVLRFWNYEVLRQRDAVLDTILAVLEHSIVEGGGELRLSPATLTRSRCDSSSPVPGEENAGSR